MLYISRCGYMLTSAFLRPSFLFLFFHVTFLFNSIISLKSNGIERNEPEKIKISNAIGWSTLHTTQHQRRSPISHYIQCNVKWFSLAFCFVFDSFFFSFSCSISYTYIIIYIISLHISFNTQPNKQAEKQHFSNTL